MGFRGSMDLAPSISWSAKDRRLMEFTSKVGFSSPTVPVRGKLKVGMGYIFPLGFAPLLSWRVAEDKRCMGFIIMVVTPRPA
jgi:hypothetical protein